MVEDATHADSSQSEAGRKSRGPNSVSQFALSSLSAAIQAATHSVLL